MIDYILNGQASGDVASRLMAHDFDPRAMRTYIGEDGRSYVDHVQRGEFTTNEAGIRVPVVNSLVTNAPATLRKDEWRILDEAILKAARERLVAVADIRAAGLTYTIAQGMGKTVLQTEKMTETTDAQVSMDGVAGSEADRPNYDLENLPLPIIHKDFFLPLRQLMQSRERGESIDTTMAEQAGRRVAETAEKMLLGTFGSYSFGGGTLYGYTNHPNRNTETLTDPTGTWTGADLLADILSMKQKSMNDNYNGPWALYFSSNWDEYLDDDFSAAKGDITVRERIAKIRGIQSIETVDYLNNYDVVLVQRTSTVARLVIGMDVTSLQWETHGGLMQHMKTMAIMVPQIRADINGNIGLVHGSV